MVDRARRRGRPGTQPAPERRRRATRRASVTLRPARADDWPDVAGLFDEVDREHARRLPGFFRVPAQGPSRRRDDFVRQLGRRDATVLVAEADGAVVALTDLQVYDTPDVPTMTPRRRVHIGDLVVSRARRRQGIGRKLLAASAAWAAAAGADELVLTVWRGNRQASAFYAAQGFAPVSTVLALPLAARGGRP